MLDAYKPRAIDLTVEALERGELVVIPTDTVYGIAARVDRPKALEALFEAKGRPVDLSLPVLVANRDQAQSLGVFEDEVSRLIGAFWPGPLTVIVPRAAGFSAELGGDGSTVGLRVPDHPVTRALLERSGPLATSSANVSGTETPRTVDRITEVFGDEVAVFLDAGPAPQTQPSTVVRIRGGELTVVRGGVLTEDRLRKVLKS